MRDVRRYRFPSSTANTGTHSQSYYKNATRPDSPSSDTIPSAPVYANPNLSNCSSATTSKPKDPVQVATNVLPVAGNEVKNIKLLQIIPLDRGCDTSTGHHLIRCSLEIFKWEISPKFIALSYIWGKDNPQNTILVNTKEFGIRRKILSFDLVSHLDHLGCVFWEHSNASGQKLNEVSFDLQHVFQCCLPCLEGKFHADESNGGFPVSSYATFSKQHLLAADIGSPGSLSYPGPLVLL